MTPLRFPRLFSACLLIAVQSHGQDLINLTNHSSDDSEPAWSPQGDLIAFISNRDGNPEVFTMRSDGSEVSQMTYTQSNSTPSSLRIINQNPAWSPDGKKLAFSSSEGENRRFHIFTANSDGTQIKQLTQTANGIDQQPSWSPDGQRIVFTSSRLGGQQLWIMNSDGTDQRQVTEHLNFPRDPFWMFTKKIIFSTFPDLEFIQNDIFVINPDGNSMTQLTKTRWNEYDPVLSPDGTEIAFTSEKEDTDPLYTNDSGIYVMSVDGKDVRRLSPFPVGHSNPTWSPDGLFIAFDNRYENEIYVMSSLRNVTAVELESWGKIKAH